MSSTTDTAKEQAGHLAGTAKDEASSVAGEAKAQARNVMDDARSMVDQQSRTGRDRVVDTTRSLSSDLEQMADNGPEGMASDIARQVAQKAREIGDMLEGREPSDLLEDVRAFARRRPGMFLMGAVAAGVVFGRMARGAKDARSSDTGTYGTPTYGTSGFGTMPAEDISTETGYGASASGTYAGTTGTGAYAGTTGSVDTGYAATSQTSEGLTESATLHGGPAYSGTTGTTGYDPDLSPEGPGDTASTTSYDEGEDRESSWSDTPLGDEAQRRSL